MSGWAQAPPPGFHGAAVVMGKMEVKALASLVKSCVLGDSQPDARAYSLEAAEVEGAVNALTFAFRTAIKGEVSQEDFQAWLSQEGVDGERAAALAGVLEQKRGAATAAYRKNLAMPELSQFDWKLGVSMASSDWCVKGSPTPAPACCVASSTRAALTRTRCLPQRLAVDRLCDYPAARQGGGW